ncbi:hypothetical protein [Methylobacterium sp. R2-1]|uniref:hypothetical protein n=1 Tax=Methylobacterium sp. R2-1 TaxID=2587064 RepID=UPI0016081387|nr:hypothetical protein [Methylobacterium sp. R2-1]MBB2962600.1 hypothetical protein [Methylobacterium sp. R2-1]
MLEKRGCEPRRGGEFKGYLTLDGGAERKECLVAELTELNAVLQVEPDFCLSGAFQLAVPELDIHSLCRVTWIKGHQHGVEFIPLD